MAFAYQAGKLEIRKRINEMRMIRIFIKVNFASCKRFLSPQFFELRMKLPTNGLLFCGAAVGFEWATIEQTKFHKFFGISYFITNGSCQAWPSCASKSSAAIGPHVPAA